MRNHKKGGPTRRQLKADEEWEWCPSCQDRNALSSADGHPLFVHGLKLTGGCETCSGTGKVVRSVRKRNFRTDKALPARA